MILIHILNCSFHRNILINEATIKAIKLTLRIDPTLVTSTSRNLPATDSQIKSNEVVRKTCWTLPSQYNIKIPESPYPSSKANSKRAPLIVCLLIVCRFRETRIMRPNQPSVLTQKPIIVNGIGNNQLEIPKATPKAISNITQTQLNIVVIVDSTLVSISAELSILASRFPMCNKSSCKVMWYEKRIKLLFRKIFFIMMNYYTR